MDAQTTGILIAALFIGLPIIAGIGFWLHVRRIRRQSRERREAMERQFAEAARSLRQASARTTLAVPPAPPVARAAPGHRPPHALPPRRTNAEIEPQRSTDDSGFVTGALIGAAVGYGLAHSSESRASESFSGGGGDSGGAGASGGWDGGSSSSRDSGSSGGGDS